MKYLLITIITFYTIQISAKNILTVDFGGKRTLINTHKYSHTGKIITYTIEGTFTDNFANYGSWDTMVITQIEQGKIVTMDFSTRWEYQDSSKIYFKGRRGDSDEDTGIGKVVVIGADENMSSLINTKCTYSIKILNENVFGIQKCELNDDAFKTLKGLNK
ncbi:MAG: hypothetical protein CFH34_00915 [Alphaproteobacteria bacterium MarineAlpha9_Bin4]|nr:hypothetical protein [Pelagibacterales bacterium]PPR26525.1 MAG: hypothetical protein CFH34_00915 [Alphaproteobacteria bacterium MarineAlpha9_Bin4]|tara:strand:+ start:2375 stop:2857 length:483 start_codon:yes stop_codon:yes gene_type:complete